MRDSVIIVNGGFDSIMLLYDKAETIALAVSLDYGQDHGAKELLYAQYHCKKLGIPHITIPLSFIHQYFKSSLSDGVDAIPEGHCEEENMESTIAPFCNGTVLVTVAGIAKGHELKRVYVVNHGDDHTICPDCCPEFTHAMNGTTEAGTFMKVRVEIPYTEVIKAEIVTRGVALRMNCSKAWSCCEGTDIRCGKCGTCVERKEVFEAAGVRDPTIYSKE